MPAPILASLAQALPRQVIESVRAAGVAPAHGDVDCAWGHFTRRHSIALTFMREYVPALRDLEKGPWACLLQIAPHWQTGRRVAYPGQERLAMLSGYDARSIRTFTKILEASGLLEVVRARLPDGSTRVQYKPGRALLLGVEQFNAQYFDDRTRAEEGPRHGVAENRSVRAAESSAARAAEAPVRMGKCADVYPQPPAYERAETGAGGRAAVASGELRDPRELNSPSSFSHVSLAEFASNEDKRLTPSDIDREVAVEALADLRERRFGRGVKLFDATVVSMVAACASIIDGDRQTKLRAQLDAIDDAFRVSRGAPTPSYIWGSIDHFLQHEARGRTARVECERVRARRVHGANLDRERAREWLRRERDACGPPPEALQLIEEFRGGVRSLAAWPSSVAAKDGRRKADS